MNSISINYSKIILVFLLIHFAQSVFAAEKCALPYQLTDSSKKIHCLDKFEFSKRKYSNLYTPLDRAARHSWCWSLAIPKEASCKNIIGFSAKWPNACMDPGAREENKNIALSMCEANGCKCSLVIDANNIVDDKLFFSYAMQETDLVALDNTEKEAKEIISNKSELKNSQLEKNQSIVNTEKEKQAQQDLQMAQELKAIEETKAKVQQELKLAQEVKAREDASSEARQKAQQELRKSQEAEASAAALAKLKQEEYEKEKLNAAAKARVLEEIKAEAYAKEKAILEAKAKAQADLKAEEIAKKQAEEQAKAQALIDEKNRVAAAKAAAEQAKKNREQEIAEEKRKITESQKKIEELKNKPLVIENSELNKPSPNKNSNASKNSGIEGTVWSGTDEQNQDQNNPGSDSDANTFAKKKGFRGAPFNNIDSSIELVAACVANNVNYLSKSKGTNFDTKGFREWTSCAMQKSINDPKYARNFEKWSDYFKNESPAMLQILGDICMKNIIVTYAGGSCYSVDYSY